MDIPMTEKELKALFKSSLLELLTEKRELVHGILVDVLEDTALMQAIQKGEKTAPVARDKIFKHFDR